MQDTRLQLARSTGFPLGSPTMTRLSTQKEIGLTKTLGARRPFCCSTCTHGSGSASAQHPSCDACEHMASAQCSAQLWLIQARWHCTASSPLQFSRHCTLWHTGWHTCSQCQVAPISRGSYLKPEPAGLLSSCVMPGQHTLWLHRSSLAEPQADS